MKKITLLIASLTLLCWQGMAQFTEGFEGSGLPLGWDTINGGDLNTWTFGAPGDAGTTNGGTQVAQITYDATTAHDDYLITPQVSVVDQSTDRLTFYARNRSASFIEEFNVLVSTTGTNVGDFSITLAANVAPPAGVWTQYQYDLSAYEGQNIYIAFQAISTNQWELYIDDVTVDGNPSCVDPTMLTATNITATSVDLGWTDASGSLWHIEWDTTGFTPGTGNMINGVTVNPHNLTGLTANTSYDFYVISDCGADSSSWVGPFTFTTACNAFTVPFSENFSSTSPTQSCWTVINNNSDGFFWDMDYTTNPLAGDEVAVIYTDANSGNDDDFLVTPTITLTGNEQLRFSYRVQSAAEPNDFQVTLSTTGVAPGSFSNTLMPLTSASNIAYQEQIINLSAYTGNVNIAFHVPPGTTDGWRLYIDSVVVEAIPNCPDPTMLTATNITATSVDLGWTDPTGSLWHIEWDTTGFTPGTGNMVNGVTVNPHNLTGLTAQTSYDFYIMSDCGADSSNWVGPFTFMTACGVITPDYTQAFASFLPNVCWDEADAGTAMTGPSTMGASPWEAGTAIGNTAKINLYTTTRSDWILTPQFDLSAGGYEVVVDVAVTDWNASAADAMGSDDSVRVLYTEDGITWNTLITWTAANNLSTSLTTFSALIPSTGANVQFGILATDGPNDDLEDYDFHVDNFIIRTPPSCPAPTALTATNITATSVDLGWTDPTGSLWHIEWDTTGFTPGTGNMVNGVTVNPHNLTGLTAQTSYDFYIMSDCGADSSNWVGPFTFMTACGVITPDYTQAFASFLPNVCWDEADAGTAMTGPSTMGASPWEAGTAIGNTAKINLYTTTRSDWILTPQFDLSAGGYEVVVDVAVTDWNASAADAMGSDDSVRVLYTEDGITWNTLITWTAADSLPNTDSTFTAMIPSTGANVQFGILATDGPNDDLEDYDFHVDTFIVRTAISTAINNNVDNTTTVNIYPNPNNGEFVLNINTKDVKELAVKIVNIQGKEVYNKTNFNNLTTINEPISLDNNAKGIYFVVITTDKGITTHKLVVN